MRRRWPPQVELNAFADLTPAQFARQHPDGFLKATPHSAASGPRPPILPLAGLPAVVDWVAVGRVPPVRHQRSSDCWAHAAATAIEAAWLIRGNQTAPATVEESRVSVQQLGGEQSARSAGCRVHAVAGRGGSCRLACVHAQAGWVPATLARLAAMPTGVESLNASVPPPPTLPCRLHPHRGREHRHLPGLAVAGRRI